MTEPLERILTIGVYGFNAETFVAALRSAGADCLVDIRARRGMRGQLYAWANSRRLQTLMAESGIRYVHLPEFAPTPAIRLLQRLADRTTATAKRERGGLAASFIQAYRQDVLSSDVLATFLGDLPTKTRRVALLCVEREAEACHRSLLAARLAAESGVSIEDLSP